MGKIRVLFEDFKGFAVGEFPYETLHGAMGEYHFRPNAWYGGPWRDPIPGKGGVKTWLIMERDGGKCIEYSAANTSGLEELYMLSAGMSDWRDVTVSAGVRPLSRHAYAGMLFRYVNSRCGYAALFHDGRLMLVMRRHTEHVVLAEAECALPFDRPVRLEIALCGARIGVSVDGRRLIDVEDSTYAAGRIAFAASAPAQFSGIEVWAEEEAQGELIRQRRARALDVAAQRAKVPQPLLAKVIDFKDFGAGRQIRFGHLLGDGELQFVLAQNQQRVFRDSHAHISCLTALNLNGDVLWQVGEPSVKHAHLTADLPFQIHDIDADGFDEVIFAQDFKIKILDGRTGKLKREAPTPCLTGDPMYAMEGGKDRYPFDHLNVDAIRVCNFRGTATPRDLVIKDRYKQVWAVNGDTLEVMWSHKAKVNTGHFPFTKDVNGDGRDELFVGYDLVSADGKLIWSLPVDTDHTDEIIIGPIDPSRGEDIIAIASGYEGFMMADLQGHLLVKSQLGHAQRVSVGNYRPELPGLELCVVTYWGNHGIIYLFDCKGNLLWQDEPGTNGNIITPVNWAGDGQDLILLNGNNALGGMIDGHNRQVVTFPEDGHPELCAEALDLFGDARDEIVLWDEHRMFIYTQDQAYAGAGVAKPAKYPHCNASNYRGEYNFPEKQFPADAQGV